MTRPRGEGNQGGIEVIVFLRKVEGRGEVLLRFEPRNVSTNSVLQLGEIATSRKEGCRERTGDEADTKRFCFGRHGKETGG